MPGTADPAPDHTIRALTKGGSPRVEIVPTAGGVAIEIRPLARTRTARRRLALLAAGVLAAAMLGGIRVGRAWEAGLRRGSFDELPLVLLVPMTLAVGVSTPLALLGLAALAFAEETIEVGPDAVSIRTTAFETTRVRVVARGKLEAWQETFRPLPPWWTWALRRLAARCGREWIPLAGAAGNAEKRAIGIALAKATGVPLIGPSGRRIDPAQTGKMPA